MKQMRKIGFVIVLWLCFAAGCFLAPFIAAVLIFPPVWRIEYMRNFVKAADRMCAAELGFSGRAMLSTELVFSTRLSWMRKGLDECETDHCIKSVYAEGPYCRLSDRKVRSK